MSPAIPVSWGELIDKVTILEIKAERLSSATARASVAQELSALWEIVGSTGGLNPRVLALKAALRQVNEELWSVENAIRAMEARQQFDTEFIRLARAIYRNNDERGRLKREINSLLQSGISEEKQYTNY